MYNIHECNAANDSYVFSSWFETPFWSFLVQNVVGLIKAQNWPNCKVQPKDGEMAQMDCA